ncbi:hypothetical protein [Seinonella peptonophila]|uniref:hypothetical protein n=1 Tax=Seinonella peptonophila TaxID=112248 RepID=UPI001114D634|nr:hypothetical protein [Seinonella peptonophila]
MTGTISYEIKRGGHNSSPTVEITDERGRVQFFPTDIDDVQVIEGPIIRISGSGLDIIVDTKHRCFLVVKMTVTGCLSSIDGRNDEPDTFGQPHLTGLTWWSFDDQGEVIAATS